MCHRPPFLEIELNIENSENKKIYHKRFSFFVNINTNFADDIFGCWWISNISEKTK